VLGVAHSTRAHQSVRRRSGTEDLAAHSNVEKQELVVLPRWKKVHALLQLGHNHMKASSAPPVEKTHTLQKSSKWQHDDWLLQQ
jgi:hypothetical protein